MLPRAFLMPNHLRVSREYFAWLLGSRPEQSPFLRLSLQPFLSFPLWHVPETGSSPPPKLLLPSPSQQHLVLALAPQKCSPPLPLPLPAPENILQEVTSACSRSLWPFPPALLPPPRLAPLAV